MSIRIGFVSDDTEKRENTSAPETGAAKITPKKSIVRVYFEERDAGYVYYNDAFDLKRGDCVWVEGKLEGIPGRVAEADYCFRVRLSDYKKVIGKADTDVHGKFLFAGSHFIAENGVLPFEKAATWFLPPQSGGENEYVSGEDGRSIILGDLSTFGASEEALNRGHDLYMQNRVSYIEIKNGIGRAIVESSRPYVVEFKYKDGEITGLTCGCYGIGCCKHEVAVLMQLRDILGFMKENYEGTVSETDFEAVQKGCLFKFLIDGNTTGGFTV